MPRSTCSSGSRACSRSPTSHARSTAASRAAATCPASWTCACKGAIGVVELERIDDLDGLRARFVEEGVFIRPFGSIVYLTPAFTIAGEELATLTRAVVKVVGSL